MSEKTVSREMMAYIRRAPKWGMALVWTLALVALGLFAVSSAIQGAPMLAPAAVSLAFTPNISPMTVAPGQSVAYSVRVVNNVANPLSSGILTVTLPVQMDGATMTGTSGWVRTGNVVTWTWTDFGSETRYFTISIKLSEGSVLGDQLVGGASCFMANGAVTDTESINMSNNHRVVIPTAVKYRTTAVISGTNTEPEAAAGEIVTVTTAFSLPAGAVAYNLHPYVVLEDGLMAGSSISPWVSITVGSVISLDPLAFGNGTQVAFESIDVITGPETLTYTVVATRTRDLFAGTPDMIANNARLDFQPLLRWCAAIGCTDWNTTTLYRYQGNSTTPYVLASNPLINSTVVVDQYLDSAGVGAGGGPVSITITADNDDGTVAAYNNILTATLSLLPYLGASPDPADVITVGETVSVVWNLPTLDSDEESSVSLRAQLPDTFEIGVPIPALSTQVYQESFPGDVPYKGSYVSGEVSFSLTPGLKHSKSSTPAPASRIRMGQAVTYTVVFTQGANTILTLPGYTDTLPLGFHLAGPISINGATLVYSDVITVTGGLEAVTWGMETLPTSATPRVVGASYRTVNTGLDTTGKHVYATVSNLTSNSLNVSNSAVLFWRGTASGMLQSAQATLRIIQPYLANTSYFTTQRGDVGDKEIGQAIQLRTRFRNTTGAPDGDAYDVRICDQLPLGFGLDGNIAPAYLTPACGDGESNFIESPAVGDNLVCWTIDRVCRSGSATNYDTIVYYAKIEETALPGIPLANYVYIQDYTSMSGTVATERHYGEIPVAIPTPARCGTPGCVVVRGLAVTKQPWQVDTVPGGWLTYTIAYSDTSSNADYTNVVITDTYDASLLNFVLATPEPSSSAPGVLVWNVGALADTHGQIELTMRAADTIPDGITGLVNTVLWKSAETTQHEISRTVPLQAANVNIAIAGSSNTHADDAVAYTVTYSNTGSVPATVTLTMDYGLYMDFVSASEPAASGDNVFEFGDVPNDGTNSTLEIQLHVKAPLPYDLAGPLVISVTATSAGAAAKSAEASTVLDRPVLVLEKIGPVVAPSVVMPFEIRLKNVGTYTATNLVFTDTWGAHLSYRDTNTSYGWSEIVAGTYATRTLSQLGIGETLSPSISFDAVVEDVVIYYTNRVDLSSSQTTKQSVTEYVWQESIETTKIADPDPAFPGRVLTYTIDYTNTVNGAVANARITDTLPAGFVYQGHSEASGVGCNYPWVFTPPASSDGGDAVWLCPTLIKDAAGSLMIWGEVMTTTEGTTLENVTESSGDGGVPARPIFEPLLTRSARPWLSVDKVVIPDHPVAPGDELTYILTYKNEGTDPAYDVVITDQLPEQFESPVCSGGDSCSYDAGVVTWNIAEVDVDEVGTVEVTVRARSDVAGQTAVNDNYSIQSGRLPVAETLSGAAISTTILDPHMSMVKTAEPMVVTTANGPLTYTITYTNDGGGDLPGVVITDSIYSRINAVSVSPECEIIGITAPQTVTCDLGMVPQGQSASLTIHAAIVSAAEGEIFANVASVQSDRTPVLLTNEALVAYAPGGCIPPMGLDFTTNPHPRVGATTTFTASALYGNPPINYSWLFDDMGSGAGTVVTHTYAVSGTYEVSLVATNPCKSGVIKTKSIQVWDLPEIVVTPASLSKQAQLGATAVVTSALAVANPGTMPLSWSMTVAPDTVSWLSVSVGSGAATTNLPGQTTPAQGSTPVTVHFDPTGLTAGSHTATLELTSNDPNQPQLSVPVTFVIADQYKIYLPLVMRDFTQS